MFHSDEAGMIGRLRKSNMVQRLDAFLRTPGYVVMIACLAALSAIFELELAVYTLYILIGVFICVLGTDLLPLMPIVICCYIAPSVGNNPGRNENSIFYPHSGGVYLMVIAAVFAGCLLWRLISDREFGGKKFWTAKRSLTSGMVLLGAAYLVSGIGMEKYAEFAVRNLVFALVQFASIIVMYFLFTGTVKWEKVPKDYFVWIGLGVGFAVLAQLGENYLSGRIFMEGSNTIDRELMATGWGMHNNIGGLMAMMMPFPFYLAYRRKHSWVYTGLATVLMLGIIASCSRTSMLVGALEFVIGSVMLLRHKDKRVPVLVVYGAAAVTVAVFAVVSMEKLLDVFALFLEEINAVSKRDLLFINGMKQFSEYPLLGGTFFPQGEFVPWDWSELEAFTSFFPPRWHNTLVQIAASCGIVGLAAYGFHRFQTLKLLLKERSTEKLFIGLFVGALLVASLLDCHFFNVGPVLMYSMALAFAERIHQSNC